MSNLNRTKVRRETTKTMPSALPLGEIAFNSDTSELFVGTGISKIKVNIKDLEQINTKLNTKATKEDVARISKGDPLFAHSVSEMTDKTKNYVNVTDGYLYVYSNGQFEKTNVLYQSRGIESRSVSLHNLTSNLAEDLIRANMLLSTYSESFSTPTMNTFGHIFTRVSYTGNTFDFFIDPHNAETNGGVYVFADTMEFVVGDISTYPCFVLVNADDTYAYSFSLSNVIMFKKHTFTEGSVQHNMATSSMPPVSPGCRVKIEKKHDSILIYTNDTLVQTIPYLGYEELYTGTTKLGFLITKSDFASIKGIQGIKYSGYTSYDITRYSDYINTKSLVQKMNKQFPNYEKMYQHFYGNPRQDWRDLNPDDFYKDNCITFDFANHSIISNSEGSLKGVYDWYCTKPLITQLEGVWHGADNWIVLKVTDTNAIALHLLADYQLRVFNHNGKVEYKYATIVNPSAQLTINGRFRVYEKEANVFTVETYHENQWTEWLYVDISGIPNLDKYQLGYGTIIYAGNLEGKVYSNVKVYSDIHDGIIITEITNTMTTSKQNSLEIAKIKEKLEEQKNDKEVKIVDLVMFMGQSNMAGRGVASESPVVPVGHGYEFRAISDPNKLHNIVEPFGVKENNPSSGVNESSKTGSMVSSFVKAYYEATKTPIVGVSCAKGGTSIDWWQPNGGALNDAIDRHNKAKTWLINNGYTIRNDFMVWCQGCSDGDKKMPSSTYQERFKKMVEEMMKHGVQKCFMVRIGNHRDSPTQYDDIISAQTELGRNYKNVVLVSTKFASMATDGLMKDQFHYKQEGYNITGRDAGINTAFYINNLKEPTMYDWEYKNLYYSYKN